MKAHQLLRQFLELFPAREPLTERICSCGDANHVRLQLFRVEGRPVLAIVPEALELTPAQFAEAAGDKRVEDFSDRELEEVFLETELGCTNLCENPFGGDVYLDEALLLYPRLVVCPRMFGGKEGECYRINTQQMLDGARPIVLRFPEPASVSNDAWAV